MKILKTIQSVFAIQSINPFAQSKENYEDQSLSTWKQYIVNTSAIIIGLISLFVMSNWIFRFSNINPPGVGTAPMAAETALSFIIFSSYLLFSGTFHHRKFTPIIDFVSIAALFVVTFNVWFRLNFVVHLPVEEALEALGVPSSNYVLGKMSSLTGAIFFILIIVMLFKIPYFIRIRFCRQAAALFALLAFLISVIVVASYMVGIPLLYSTGFTLIAIPSSISLLLLGFAFLITSSEDAFPLNLFKSEIELFPGDIKKTPFTRTGWILLSVTTILSTLVIIYLHIQVEDIKAKAIQELNNINELQTARIVNWYNQQKIDAQYISNSVPNQKIVADFLLNPANPVRQTEFKVWIDLRRNLLNYKLVTLLNSHGNVVFSYPKWSNAIPENHPDTFERTMHADSVVLRDMHRDYNAQGIIVDDKHFSLWVPIHAKGNTNAPIAGILALEIKPEVSLYPILAKWPIATRSGETVMYEPSGKDILVLNDLRNSRLHTAMIKLRIGSFPQLMAVRALKGDMGAREGLDYRKKQVFSFSRQIPGTPWYLTTKIDKSEVLAPLYPRILLVTLMLLAIIFLTALAYGFNRRKLDVRYMQKQLGLVEENLLLSRLLENSFQPFGMGTPDGRLVRFNQAFLDLVGYTKEELIVMDWATELTPPEWFESESKYLATLMETGEPVRYEKEYIHKDGHRIPIDFLVHVMKDKDGKIEFFYSFLNDLTERKKAEKTLRESEERFRAIFEQSGVGVLEVDAETGDFLHVNRMLCQMLGYTREELTNRSFIELTHPDDLGSSKNALQTLKVGNTDTFRFEKRYLRKDGSTVWVDLSITALQRTEGKRYTNIGVLNDITARKLMETEMIANQERLALSQRIGHVGSMEVDVKANKTWLSEEGLRIFGLPADSGWLYRDYLRSRIVEKDKVFHYVEELESGKTEEAIEYDLMPFDGSPLKHIRANTIRFLNEKGELVRLVSAVQDITDIKKSQMQLAESEKKFRTIFESTNVGKTIAYPDGRNEVNRAFCDMLGMEMDAKPESWAKVTYPDDLELTYKVREELFSGKTDHLRFQKRYYHKDGHVVWTDVSSTIYKDKEGTPLYIVSSILDITKQKDFEEKLKETNSYLQNLFDYANAPIIVWDKYFRITQFNHAFERLTAYKSEEVVGKKLEFLFPSDAKGQAMDRIADTLSGEYWDSVEIPILCNDSSIRIALWNSANLFSEDGSQVIATIAQGQDITDRMMFEEKLKETNAYLQNLFNYANAPIIVWDKDFRITQFNHAFERLTAYKAEEVIGNKLEFLFPTDAKSQAMDRIADTLSGEYWDSVEIPILSKDGSIRIALWNSANLFSEDGSQVIATIAQGQDITERMLFEEKLKETNAYLQNLFNYANAPIIVWNKDFRITQFNHAFERLTGYKEAEVSGNKLDFLFPYEAKGRALGRIADTVGGEYWDSVEIPILCKDGAIRIVLWNSANLLSDDGITVIATIAQGQDITERKKIEQAILESERYLQSIIDRAPFGAHTFELMPDGKLYFRQANQFAEIMLGIKQAALEGLELEEAFPSVVGTDVPEQYIKVAVTGEPYSLKQFNYTDNKMAGIFEIEAVQIGKNRMIAFFRDITETWKAEQEIKKLNESLEQRVKERTAELERIVSELESFAYSVSHDLRTPLRGIDGWSQVLLEDYSDKIDADGKQSLRLIREETQRMGNLIDALLQMSRINRNDMLVGQVNLSNLVMSWKERMVTEDSNRSVKIEIQPDLIVNGDSKLLDIALTNLLDNAWKFTSGKEEAEITFGMTEIKKKPTYFIKDNGVGFDMAFSAMLFKAFQRLHKEADFPGTGIGLATVARIIRRHGGNIWAEGVVNGGATFYFTLKD